MADIEPIRRARAIGASTRVTGERRWASVAAAERQIRDGKLYLLRRNGLLFRPEAHGYTEHLDEAGIYEGSVARRYMKIEGMAAIPLRAMASRIRANLPDIERTAAELRRLLALATPATPPAMKGWRVEVGDACTVKVDAPTAPAAKYAAFKVLRERYPGLTFRQFVAEWVSVTRHGPAPKTPHA